MSLVTWIIGNGFDICVGLKTRYTDFYKEYTATASNDEVIERFKKEILQDEAFGWKNWADFELGMGEQSQLFDGEIPAKDFLNCYSDFVKKFNAYLDRECAKIQWNDVDGRVLADFGKTIMDFNSYLATISSNYIQNTLRINTNSSIHAHSFLQFNYTDAFDNLLRLGWPEYTGMNLHIHGKINENPIIGVDSTRQIQNSIISRDTNVRKIFVKQQYYKLLQQQNVMLK